MMSDSFIFSAGSLFFAAWIAIITGVTVTAFGRDLLPSRAQADPASTNRPAKPLRPTTTSRSNKQSNAHEHASRFG
jgi:hypothetical protein